MSKYQRTKGANGEREIVNMLKVYGLAAKRISMMETNGQDKGDIEIGEGFTKDRCQVKIGNQVPKFIYDALGEYDYLFSRKDRKKWLVTMTLDNFIFLKTKK